MTVYADSSFIASIYSLEVHSAEARRRISARPEVSLTPLNRTELAHAINLQVFRERISAAEARRVWANFAQDCAQRIWSPVVLPVGVWEASIDLARRHGPKLGVRTLDSLHVACALELKAERFWTFDTRRERLAQAVGLNTGP